MNAERRLELMMGGDAILPRMSDTDVAAVLAQIGAHIEPVENPKYRLNGASYRLGVSAKCQLNVFSGTSPVQGVTAYTLFPDDNGDLPQLTIGDGSAVFNGSPGWAFTPGQKPAPIRVGLAKSAVKTGEPGEPKHVTVDTPLSPVVHFGDPEGTHLELYLQFVDTTAEPPAPPPLPAPAAFDLVAFAAALRGSQGSAESLAISLGNAAAVVEAAQ